MSSSQLNESDRNLLALPKFDKTILSLTEDDIKKVLERREGYDTYNMLKKLKRRRQQVYDELPHKMSELDAFIFSLPPTRTVGSCGSRRRPAAYTVPERHAMQRDREWLLESHGARCTVGVVRGSDCGGHFSRPGQFRPRDRPCGRRDEPPPRTEPARVGAVTSAVTAENIPCPRRLTAGSNTATSRCSSG